MKNLQQGENISLDQLGITSEKIFSGISWIAKNNQQIDIHIGLQQNAPEEQQSQIYLFKLNQKL